MGNRYIPSHIGPYADIFYKLKDFLSLYTFPLHDIINDLIKQKTVIDLYDLCVLIVSDGNERGYYFRLLSKIYYPGFYL